VTAWRASLISATSTTRVAAATLTALVFVTATILLIQYPTLPDLLPVRFGRDGMPIGWQFKTYGRVLMPVLVQVALAATFGGVGALLSSRTHDAHDGDAPDVRAAATATEAVILIAAIWVAFQGYAAVALVAMWSTGRGGLGLGYTAFELLGLVLTGIVAARAHARLGRPSPRPFVAEHWRFGQLYRNPDAPALFVPTRDGSKWTLNFGRPIAAGLLGLILVIGVVAPTIILTLALR
jgi:uncharacterized membrane protein